MIEEFVGWAGLDDLACVHDNHPVGDIPHGGDVVADEDHAEAQLLLEVGEQIQHLGPHRHVEGRGRLVRDNDVRLKGERASDRDTLPLAARDLAWEHVKRSMPRLGTEPPEFVGIGLDSRGRAIELVVVLNESTGDWLIKHAQTPPQERIKRELGFGRRNS